MNNHSETKLLTLLSFITGYILIDYLDTNEQNALGNFLMLTGQTLCTSAAENYRKNSKSLSKSDIINMLKKANNIFSDELNKI